MINETINLREQQLSLLIGTLIGQMSGILNGIGGKSMSLDDVYKELFDIHKAAGLQIHELYYKGNKP